MEKLPHPDNMHLNAAEGWVELGNCEEANWELAQITTQFQMHPFVLEVRYKIYAEQKRWDKALEMAQAVRHMLPENAWGYFHLAFALHELKRTQEAYDTVVPIVGQFPDDYLMRFNLACYACQLGKQEEALDWLKKAADLAGDIDIRKQALEDPDLTSLRPQIRKLLV